MSAKTHTTAVVLIPPAEVWPTIQVIRQQHDRNARRYRSQPWPGPGYRGPDAAWYIVDTSDPAQALAHVYVLEV